MILSTTNYYEKTRSFSFLFFLSDSNDRLLDKKISLLLVKKKKKNI